MNFYFLLQMKEMTILLPPIDPLLAELGRSNLRLNTLQHSHHCIHKAPAESLMALLKSLLILHFGQHRQQTLPLTRMRLLLTRARLLRR